VAAACAERLNTISRPFFHRVILQFLIELGEAIPRFSEEIGQSLPLPTCVSNFRSVASFRNYSASKDKLRPRSHYFE